MGDEKEETQADERAKDETTMEVEEVEERARLERQAQQRAKELERQAEERAKDDAHWLRRLQRQAENRAEDDWFLDHTHYHGMKVYDYTKSMLEYLAKEHRVRLSQEATRGGHRALVAVRAA